MSVSLITRTTPTPEASLLRWLDGTDGDDHAAYEAFGLLLAEAERLLREPGMAVPSRAATGFLALLKLRDADAAGQS